MFMRTLRHGLAVFAAAIAMIGVVGGPAAAEPMLAQDQCQLSANVVFSTTDPTRRPIGIGAVVCAGAVYEITVTVALSQDSVVVARDRNVCQGQAACRVAVSAANPPGIQLWCAVATGTFQVTPLGPTFDLGSKRFCARG